MDALEPDQITKADPSGVPKFVKKRFTGAALATFKAVYGADERVSIVSDDERDIYCEFDSKTCIKFTPVACPSDAFEISDPHIKPVGDGELPLGWSFTQGQFYNLTEGKYLSAYIAVLVVASLSNEDRFFYPNDGREVHFPHAWGGSSLGSGHTFIHAVIDRADSPQLANLVNSAEYKLSARCAPAL